MNVPFNKYSQLVNLSHMTFCILKDDMDGIIINPGDENVLISRDVLLEFAPVIEDICNDSRLNNAIEYMYVIGDE